MEQEFRKLPDSELEIMQIIWDSEPPVGRAAIEEKLLGVHAIAQTTLLTLLSRLREKGFIRIEKAGRSSVVWPLVERENYQKLQSRNFVHRLFGGNMRSFANALCEGGLSEEELKELKALLRED